MFTSVASIPQRSKGKIEVCVDRLTCPKVDSGGVGMQLPNLGCSKSSPFDNQIKEHRSETEVYVVAIRTLCDTRMCNGRDREILDSFFTICQASMKLCFGGELE